MAELHVRHSAGLRSFLLGVLKDPHLADEALQQTFLRVMEKGHTATPDTMRGWIYKVAFHEAMALKRRRPDAAPPRLDFDALRSDTDVEADVMAGDDLRLAAEAVAELPDAQREVLRLRFSESKTFAEIAAQLGVPLGTALTRMRLALEKLRRRCGGLAR